MPIRIGGFDQIVGEPEVGRHLVGGDDADVRDRIPVGVAGAQCPCRRVDVDRPHRGARGAAGHRERDRAGAAAEIEEVAGRRDGQVGTQQHRRGGVEVATREDASIGLHHEGGVGQGHVDQHRIRRGFGLIIEVVARGGPVTVGGHSRSLAEMSYTIRTYGDPVLKTQASLVDDVNGKIIRLVDDMFDTLVDSGNGIALAAPQIGVQKQVVVWDIDEKPLAIVNPEIVESDGEWAYDEGCLSIPGSVRRDAATEDRARRVVST